MRSEDKPCEQVFVFQGLLQGIWSDGGYNESDLTLINPKESKKVLEIMQETLSLQAMKNNMDKISKHVDDLNFKEACKHVEENIGEDSNQDLDGRGLLTLVGRLQNDAEIMKIIRNPESFIELIPLLFEIDKNSDQMVKDWVITIGNLITAKKRAWKHEKCLAIYHKVNIYQIEFLRK